MGLRRHHGKTKNRKRHGKKHRKEDTVKSSKVAAVPATVARKRYTGNQMSGADRAMMEKRWKAAVASGSRISSADRAFYTKYHV